MTDSARQIKRLKPYLPKNGADRGCLWLHFLHTQLSNRLALACFYFISCIYGPTLQSTLMIIEDNVHHKSSHGSKFIMSWYWHRNKTTLELHNFLTCNVRGPSYLGLAWSISWLLIPWLLTSPGHQQPWYWLCRICRSWSYLRKDFKYLCHINLGSNGIKCKYIFMFPLKIYHVKT